MVETRRPCWDYLRAKSGTKQRESVHNQYIFFSTIGGGGGDREGGKSRGPGKRGREPRLSRWRKTQNSGLFGSVYTSFSCFISFLNQILFDES